MTAGRLAAIAAVLVSCNALTGADLLQVDTEAVLPAASPPSSVDAAPVEDGERMTPEDATLPSVDATPDQDASATLLRAITFEDGTLEHPTSGFDSIFGAPKVTSTFALRGAFAMAIDGDRTGGIFTFAPIADVTVTFRVRIAPSSSSSNIIVVRVRLVDGKRVDLEITSSPSRVLRVMQGSTISGTGGALPSDARTYRVALRVGPSITVRVAEEESPFGAPAIVSTPVAPAPAKSIEIGSIDDGDIVAIFDDVIVETTP